MLERNTLVKDLNNRMNIYQYSDYGPNGLQVEGSPQIKKIAFAVSATRYSIQKAVELEVQMLIVHHGLFWKFHGPRTITGAFYHRVAPLIQKNINLLGYHLPLDANLEFGNAASIAKELKCEKIEPFGDHKGMPTGVKAKFSKALEPEELSKKLKLILNHEIIHAQALSQKKISTIGIITGGANSDWIQARNLNLDAYLTGEISEHDWHEASEGDVHYFAGGHNATESLGIQNLMKYVHEKYNSSELELFYIPSHNPA